MKVPIESIIMRDIFKTFEQAKGASVTNINNIAMNIEIQNLGKKNDMVNGEHYEFKVIYKEE